MLDNTWDMNYLAAPQPAPTSIDYLTLISQEDAQAMDYHVLIGQPAAPAMISQPASDHHSMNHPVESQVVVQDQ